MTLPKTLIVHGLDGSPAPHWQHWWAATEAGALAVDLPAPACPDPLAWETELIGMILRHPDSILVGHSLGAVLIAQLLGSVPDLRVRAALLVAPAEVSLSGRISAFAPLPERRLPVPTVLVASRNDPWMRFGRARDLAKSWGSRFVDQGIAGHINAAAGYGPWPRGKELRDALAAETLAPDTHVPGFPGPEPKGQGAARPSLRDAAGLTYGSPSRHDRPRNDRSWARLA